MTTRNISFKIKDASYNTEISLDDKLEMLYDHIREKFGRKDFIVISCGFVAIKSNTFSHYVDGSFVSFAVIYGRDYDEYAKKCKK